ncbi:MAG: nucleoside triphosphate pyrophosphohydrolase [Candidatus Saccharimonadales bacterium]
MKIYNKLVRDKIPEIIEADGETPVTRILDEEEYLQELIKKLGEEYEEFKEAVNVEELADLQEVILALADVIANREELEKVRAEKATKRGGFKDKIFLESTE